MGNWTVKGSVTTLFHLFYTDEKSSWNQL